MAEVDNALWADYTPVSERKAAQQAVEMSTRRNDELDKNAFLMLLITQMKYQDPLNPVEDKEFISQMAQFSALEQMQNLNQTMSNSQTFSLVGKYVAGDLYNSQTGTSSEIAGRVASVVMRNKQPFLVVSNYDGKTVEAPMSDITNVYEDENQLAMTRAGVMNSFTAQNVALIGKYIQAITMDAEGKKATGFVEGTVDYVKLVGGSPVLVVGNKDVYPTELISVSDSKMLVGLTIQVAKKVAVTNEGDDSDEVDATEAIEDGTEAVEGGTEAVEGGTEAAETEAPATEYTYVYHPHTIIGVEIDGDVAKLVLDDGSKIEIDKIDSVTEALKFVDKEVKTSKTSGIVTGVFISSKVPNLILEDGTTILFSAVIR